MASPSMEGRRGLTPFRLSDVPITVRRRAAEPLLRIAADSADAFTAIMLTRAVDEPSERVYWIPAAAWDEQVRKRAWKR